MIIHTPCQGSNPPAIGAPHCIRGLEGHSHTQVTSVSEGDPQLITYAKLYRGQALLRVLKSLVWNLQRVTMKKDWTASAK